MISEAMVPVAILDAHADCLNDLAFVLAQYADGPKGEEARAALDRYAALIGRENVPDAVWQAMSRG